MKDVKVAFSKLANKIKPMEDEDTNTDKKITDQLHQDKDANDGKSTESAVTDDISSVNADGESGTEHEIS